MEALNFPAIEAKCLEIAARSNVSIRYALDLRHIASDCRSAADGCRASAECVNEWLEYDRLLDAELGDSQWLNPPGDEEITRASESYIPVRMVA